MSNPIPNFQFNLSQEAVRDVLRRPTWIFDPPPEWLDWDKGRLERFAKLQIEFKIREMQIQEEKLRAIQELMG